MATIQTLAADMNVKPADVAAFLKCLSVWMAKGYSLEAAIDKHMAQMVRLASKSDRLPKSLVVDAFFPA